MNLSFNNEENKICIPVLMQASSLTVDLSKHLFLEDPFDCFTSTFAFLNKLSCVRQVIIVYYCIIIKLHFKERRICKNVIYDKNQEFSNSSILIIMKLFISTVSYLSIIW